jgi:hypothetical protein
MPSFLHEALLLLLRNRATVVPELLGMTELLPLPRFSSAHIESTDLSEVVPAEYRADLLVLLRQRDRPVLGIVAEVQLAPDERKRFTWPYYQASARAKYECDVVVLVVAPKGHTARWARRPISLGGDNHWSPLVLGPEDVPLLTDPRKMERHPELGVLSVMAHGRGEPVLAARIAEATLQALRHVPDEETRVLYFDLIDAHLGAAARKALTMLPEGYQYQSKFGNRRFAEGRAEGLRTILRKQLTHRFGKLPPTCEARIDGAAEQQLETWAERILDAHTIEDVFRTS